MLKQSWSLLLCCVLLPSCTVRKPKLEAPEVRLVELILSDPESAGKQSYELILRLRNTSEVELVVSSYEFDLVLDGQSAGIHRAQPNVTIPVLSNENVRSSGQLGAFQARALASIQDGRRGQMPYSLKGVVDSQGQSFTLLYDGWLSRSPGKRGSFR